MTETTFDDALDALLSKPPPSEPRPVGGLGDHPRPAVGTLGRSCGALAGATGLVAAVILLNLVLQHALVASARHSHLGVSRGLIVALGAGLAFYGFVGVVAVMAGNALRLRTPTVIGAPGTAIGRGVLTGGGIGLALALAARAVGSGDPMSTLLASDGRLGVLVLGVLSVVVVGPAVEELVFRGLFAESMRGWGRGAAVWISAAAFSLAHLQLAQFRYFVWMGAVFGAIWWKRGLLASFAAHATFNGALFMVAVVGAHGPGVTVHSASGVSWRLPSGWHTVTVANEDLAVLGPHAATVEVAHFDGTTTADLATLESGLRRGVPPLPGAVVEPLSIRSTAVAGRAAVTVRITSGPAATPGSQLVFIADGTRRWIIVAQHVDDTTFTQLLSGLMLP